MTNSELKAKVMTLGNKLAPRMGLEKIYARNSIPDFFGEKTGKSEKR